MFNTKVLSAVVAAAVMTCACGAFAADDAATPAAAPKAAHAKLTKAQRKEIEKSCKAEHAKDKAGYKACVKDKEKAA